MKKTIITGIVSSGLLSVASAYTVTFLNVDVADNTAVPILDNAGDPIALSGGYVSVGTFASVPSSVEDVRSFVSFGDGNSTFTNEIDFPGFFDSGRSAPIPEGTVTAPVGQPVYVVIGNGDSLATSDFFAVYDPGLVFGTEDSVGAGALDIIIDSSTLTPESLVFGDLVENVSLEGIPFDEGIQLTDGVMIPEPSTSLLAALAGLALVGRRRR